MGLTCPKCGATMRQYERNRVTVDQCTECRGIFLDRGELDHLIEADSQFHRQAAPPPPPPPPQYREERRYDDRRYDDHHRGGDSHYYKKKKKRSLFSELFDD